MADTNFHAWRSYTPNIAWLQGLWREHKVTHDQYLALSCRFRETDSERQPEPEPEPERERQRRTPER